MSNLQSVSKPMNTAFGQSVFRRLVLSIIGIAIAHFCFTAPVFAQGVSLGTVQTVIAAPESENSPAAFFNGIEQESTQENHTFNGCPNLFAGGLQLLGLVVGVPMVLFGMMQMAAGSQEAMKRVMFGAAALGTTMIAPSAMNMLISIWC
jgi:hypothetical protein